MTLYGLKFRCIILSIMLIEMEMFGELMENDEKIQKHVGHLWKRTKEFGNVGKYWHVTTTTYINVEAYEYGQGSFHLIPTREQKYASWSQLFEK